MVVNVHSREKRGYRPGHTSGFVRNGARGTVTAANAQELTVDFDGIGKLNLPAAWVANGGVGLAYALTSHAVQGAQPSAPPHRSSPKEQPSPNSSSTSHAAPTTTTSPSSAAKTPDSPAGATTTTTSPPASPAASATNPTHQQLHSSPPKRVNRWPRSKPHQKQAFSLNTKQKCSLTAGPAKSNDAPATTPTQRCAH